MKLVFTGCFLIGAFGCIFGMFDSIFFFWGADSTDAMF
jgi:hypothetical protein